MTKNVENGEKTLHWYQFQRVSSEIERYWVMKRSHKITCGYKTQHFVCRIEFNEVVHGKVDKICLSIGVFIYFYDWNFVCTYC